MIIYVIMRIGDNGKRKRGVFFVFIFKIYIGDWNGINLILRLVIVLSKNYKEVGY